MTLGQWLDAAERELTQMRSALVLSQVQPHFLYNSLTAIAQLCEQVAESQTTMDGLDTAAGEKRLRELEEGGVRFMTTKYDKRKKKTGPLIAAAVMAVLMGWLIALVLWANAVEPVPWWILALALVIFAGIIVGVLRALLERIREINGGEEDEAIQY